MTRLAALKKLTWHLPFKYVTLYMFLNVTYLYIYRSVTYTLHVKT